jgi:hypothetical protein
MIAALCLALGWGGSAKAAESGTKADASVEFFESGVVPHLRIEISGTNLANLRRDNRKYVRAKVSEGDTVYPEVAIHLKGAAGSFRGLEDRPALTLNFGKFQPHQRYHGLDKLHLNNSVQDPSYMTEILCGDLFLAAGVPAARGAHARVVLNGRELGLYVLKEGFDKTFLRRHFKNVNGNLYDGGFLRDLTEPLDKTSGEDVANYADLKAVVAAAQERDPAKRFARLEQVLDMERFLSFLALEAMTWHWDGYGMKKNNYRIYHQPDVNKVVFLPHGMDQMFWEPNGPILPNFDGLVARAVVGASEGRERYYDRLAWLRTNVFKVETLTNRINQLQARLRPVLAALSRGTARNHDGAVDHLRQLILERAAYLDKQLGQARPKPIKFDAEGVAVLAQEWRVEDNEGGGSLDQPRLGAPGAGGRQTLHIRARRARCTASWRTRVHLEPGTYRFEALARCAGLAPTRDERGEGAGIRISGSQRPRPNKLRGEASWTPLAYDFKVLPGTEEVELVCELRASKGDVWFDARAFKLVRKGK